MLIRLNKYLASMGVASRRKIDEFTVQGRITINSEFAKLGDKVNPETDTVIVDKKIIKPSPQTLVYYLLNKPKYVLSTSHDDRGRHTVLEYVPTFPRVFPVGRLDYESTGLILLTNDGNLALRLTHPRYHLPKTYLVTVLGKVTEEKLSQMNTVDTKVKKVAFELNQTTLEMILYTGKKRQIRLMCADLHLHVLDLHRIAIGPITIGNLEPGKYRPLTSEEIKKIM